MSIAEAGRARVAGFVDAIRAVPDAVADALDDLVVRLHRSDDERVEWPDGFPRCSSCRPPVLYPCDELAAVRRRQESRKVTPS